MTMILCKYFDLNGFDVLYNLRLKVTDPLTFNDPFEFSSYVEGKIQFSDFKRFYKHPSTLDRWYPEYKDFVGAKNKREFKDIIRNKNKESIYKNFEPNIIANLNGVLKKVRTNFAKNCRVLCFSDPNQIEPYEEILMWSHYGNSHKGFKIFFDIDKFRLKSRGPFKVEYHKERTRLDATKIMFNEKEVFDDFGKSLTDKGIAWSYEHEYRWLINIEECLNEVNAGIKYDFIRIIPEAITRVDIGVRYPNERIKEIIQILGSNKFGHAVFKKAVLDKKDYKLNFEDIDN